MRVLFVHQNFPAQYKHVSAALGRGGENDVVALGVQRHPVPAGVRAIHYQAPKQNSGAHYAAQDFDTKAAWGEAAAAPATALKREGFVPDIICGHPGWGEMMFLRDVWPDARTLSFMEFFFRPTGTDFGFGGATPDLPHHYRLRARNAPFLMALEASEWSVSPTLFQWNLLPRFAQKRTSLIHEGVDTRMFRRNDDATITLGRAGIVCRPGDEIVTFVNRNLEPHRGFHIFMRALPEILRRRPQARAVIVGGDGASYGPAAPQGTTWKAVYTQEVAARLDFSRVHFVGRIPYNIYLNLLQVSAAHVYLSYPFVLSWSMLEAMAAECLVIGSATAPVQEVIEHGRNGILVDFFSPAQLAEAVIRALEAPDTFRHLRVAARQTIQDHFDLNICLPRQLALIADVAAGRTPKDRYLPAGIEENPPSPGVPVEVREPAGARGAARFNPSS